MRLDNVVYRLGFADSRNQARQLVRHGHFQVNGRRVNIPSYQLRPDEVITVPPNSAAMGASRRTGFLATLHRLPAYRNSASGPVRLVRFAVATRS